MSLYYEIYRLLDGKTTNVSIVVSDKAITFTPARPISVPTGYGFNGSLESAIAWNNESSDLVLQVRVPILGIVNKKVRLT